VGRLDNIDKPIILEHDGIKEIISRHDAEIFAETGDICIKCKHFNCVCDLP